MDREKSQKTLPILLIAFNRPKTLQRQFQNLDLLTPRKIVVHVDGARGSKQKSQKEVLALSERWAGESNHEVDIKAKNSNLGLRKHFPVAANDFFGSHKFGIVLEDDIIFGQSFIDLCERVINSRNSENLWSICGHNPYGRIVDENKIEINLRLSHIHTIWGWATSSVNIERYLSYATKRKDEMFKDIDSFSSKITRDVLLQRAINLTWRRKITRYFLPNSGGSWDNLWELAGWNSKLPSLMPSHSLSTEFVFPTESGTHSSERTLQRIYGEASVESIERVSAQNNSLDIRMMRMWGISRKYSWGYALRIASQLRNLENL